MTKKGSLFGAIALALSLTVVAAQPAKRARSGEPGILDNAVKLQPLNIKQCPHGAKACVVKVTVSPAPGGKCTIRPEADLVKIDAGMTVLWVLDKPWAFDPTGGIEFKDPKPPFESKRLSDQVWQAKSANTAASSIYNYGIKVSSDKNSCSIDPGIWV